VPSGGAPYKRGVGKEKSLHRGEWARWVGSENAAGGPRVRCVGGAGEVGGGPGTRRIKKTRKTPESRSTEGGSRRENTSPALGEQAYEE